MLAFSELAISKGVATNDEARSTTLKNIVTRVAQRALSRRRRTGRPSPRTDADGECELRSEPEGGAYRFIALRYEKPRRGRPAAGSHSNNRGKDEAEFHLD